MKEVVIKYNEQKSDLSKLMERFQSAYNNALERDLKIPESIDNFFFDELGQYEASQNIGSVMEKIKEKYTGTILIGPYAKDGFYGYIIKSKRGLNTRLETMIKTLKNIKEKNP